ncbi:MAG: hypothetical protein U5L05_08060 [Rubrivivax sp.]|nr:hypothetical protein [Rubrivivax sp.]
MAKIEELEMDAHRAQLNSDLRRLVVKYRAIFGWDVPEIDEALSQRLIIESLRRALDDLEAQAAAARA